MARCGRCGLWAKYPDNHHEKKYAGVCLWYQTRLVVPGMTAMDHLDYKIKRDNLGDAYLTAKRSKLIAYIGLTISVISLTASLYRTFHQ